MSAGFLAALQTTALEPRQRSPSPLRALNTTHPLRLKHTPEQESVCGAALLLHPDNGDWL